MSKPRIHVMALGGTIATRPDASGVMQMGAGADDLVKAVPLMPTLADIAKTPEQRAIVDLVFSGLSMSRPFTAPPDTAPARLAALRKAFAAVAQDGELLTEAARARNAIVFTPPDEIDRILAKAFATDPATIAKVQAITRQ